MLPNPFFRPDAEGPTLEARKQAPFVLCLSGGGTRAAIFHLGLLTGLARVGALTSVDAISAVSGGSIVAAKYSLELARAAREGRELDFGEFLAALMPVLSEGFRNRIVRGLLDPSFRHRRRAAEMTRTDLLASVYDEVLFGGATLADLAGSPQVAVTATCMNDGLSWLFMRSGVAGMMGFARGTETQRDDIPVAFAVAASCAVPGLLPPIRRDRGFFFAPGDGGGDTWGETYSRITLSDGGLADNLGLIGLSFLRLDAPVPPLTLMSDGGASLRPLASPPRSVVLGVLPGLGRFVGEAGVIGRTMDVMKYHITEFIAGVEPPREFERPRRYLARVSRTVPDGLPADVVGSLGRIRTDLDRFSRMESYALLPHGMTHAVAWFGGLLDEDARRDLTLEQPSAHWLARARSHLEASRHRSWLVRRGRRLVAAGRESPEWGRIARAGGGGWEP